MKLPEWAVGTLTVKCAKGYYCGHPKGVRASWSPSFEVRWTQNEDEALRVSEKAWLNLTTNLALLGHAPLIGGFERP